MTARSVVFIHANDFRRVLRGVAVKLYLDLGRLIDHVVVRQDVSAACPQSRRSRGCARPVAGHPAGRQKSGRRNLRWDRPGRWVRSGASLGFLIHHLGRGDIHHGRFDARDNRLNELDEGMGSGSASGVAFVPAKENAFMAETLPEITVPIRMPTTSVAATNPATTNLRRRVQSTISRT